jgi:6-phosphogluconolactonase
MFAYVGSRTTRERNARGDGISVFQVDPSTGALHLLQVVGDLVNPSFLAYSARHHVLYSVHGDQEEVSAFRVDPASGRLSALNQRSCEGRNPVHLALDPTERFLVVSNHLTSTLAVLALGDDGAVGDVVQLLTLEGTPGPHRKEQPFSKPHFNPFDPTGRFVVVPDKGLDRVFSFRFEAGRLIPASTPSLVCREASGPRHLAFHPTQPWAYTVNELDSTVTANRLDVESGRLSSFQIVSTLADTYTGNSRASEIEMNATGTKLYASNRGEESIAVLDVDAGSGRLALQQTMPAGGKTPRFFALDPSGRWLFVLNEDSDNIVTMSIDPQSGALALTAQQHRCASPVCMVFVPQGAPR